MSITTTLHTLELTIQEKSTSILAAFRERFTNTASPPPRFPASSSSNSLNTLSSLSSSSSSPPSPSLSTSKGFRVGEDEFVYRDISFWFGTCILGTFVIIAHLWFLFYLQDMWETMPDKRDPESPFDVITWIPIFVVTILAEWLYGMYRKAKLYRVNDTMCSISTSLMLTMSKKLLYRAYAIAPYAYVYHNYAVTNMFESHLALGWWIMLFAVEFGYYWVHRTGHTMNFFWAMHSVHHSSEEYNLSTALRQSCLHNFVSWTYYMPLALFFPPALFFIQSDFNLLYQYFIHTRVIGKLGPLEWFLNTPSQHRVHHGRNEWCIDTNYGGTLCIFDRMFGTYQEEIEDRPIVYGLTHSIQTFNPIEVNAIAWRDVWANMQVKEGLKHKFFCLWNGPGWVPASDPPEEWPIPSCTRQTVQAYNTVISYATCTYLFAHFLLVVGMFERALSSLSGPNLFFVDAMVVMVFLSLLTFGMLTDRKPHAWKVELGRLALGAAMLSYLAYHIVGSWWDDNALMSSVVVSGAIITLVSVLFIVHNRHDLSAPLLESEIGKDLPGAETHERMITAHSQTLSEKEKRMGVVDRKKR